MYICVYLCYFVEIIAIFFEILLFFPKTTILPRSRHLPSYKFPGPLQTSPSRRVSMIEPIFKSFRGTRAKTSTETFKNPVRRPISGHPPFEIIAIFWDIAIFVRYCYFYRGSQRSPRPLPEPPRASQSLQSLPELSRDGFLTFVGSSHAKPSLLRAFLEGIRLKIVSKVGVLDERSLKKSKKHCTGASPESPSIVKNN